MSAAPESLITLEDVSQMLSLAASTPRGAFIEVGVYKGGSAWHLGQLAQMQNRTLYLCDTFEGIPYADPEMGDAHKVGDFADVSFGEVRRVIRNGGLDPWCVFVKGIFPESWSLFETRFSFAHLDCDQYRSIKDSCGWLIPRMIPGGVIWFDDVDRLKGATRAATELFGDRLKRDLSHPYVRMQ